MDDFSNVLGTDLRQLLKLITVLVVLIQILKLFLKFGSGLPMNDLKEKRNKQLRR